MAEAESAHYPCPACGRALYGWTAAHDPLDRGTRIVLDRCESCRLAITRAPTPPDPDAELELWSADLGGGRLRVVAPNLKSFQGGIGGAQWAGLEPELRRCHLTPEAVRLLLAGRGLEPSRTRTPFSGRSYRGMLQTLINAFTLRDNFIRNARSGRLRPAGTRQRLSFALDSLVSVLVALPMAIIALPLEALGAATGRGGVLEVEAGPDTGRA